MSRQRLNFIAFCGVFSLISTLFVVSVLSCSHTPANPDDPDALYKEAEEAFEDERYLVAIEKYRDIKNRFPYSPRATDSELRIADTFFAQESYLEAESAYEVFRELHPTHPKSHYVQFRIGLSYYHQIPTNSAQDLSAAYRAIDAFETLARKFPSSEHVSKARELVKEARTRLADYQNYVANFYYQRKHYLSASYRYASLLQDYPNLGYDEEALYRLGESYYHIRMFDNARDALRRLVAGFPKSEFKDRSLALLKELEK